MLSQSTASSAAPRPAGRAAGTSTSAPHTRVAPEKPAAAENARMFASNAGRASGRCAANTTVDSVTPSLAIQAVTSAVTVIRRWSPCPTRRVRA
jgi:hypothetical protein